MTQNGLHVKRGYTCEKLMVIVDDQHLDMLDELMSQKKRGFQVVYTLTDSPVVRSIFPHQSRIYPLEANIRSLLRFDIVDGIVCCTTTLPDKILRELAEISWQFGVLLMVLPGRLHASLPVTGLRYLAGFGYYVLETNPSRRSCYKLKSIAETLVAGLLLVASAPFMVVIAAIVKATSEGPVFFKQQRVGLRGRKFYLYKFRTMVADAESRKASLSMLNETDGPAFKIANDPRITSFGRILRKTGLDELPQLYNVIKGEMSLIGPRPMLPGEVSEQQEWQLKRMCIKPGITCTWQIQPQRNKVPFDSWMKFDRDYIENWSLATDLRIFAGTVKSVFAARGL